LKPENEIIIAIGPWTDTAGPWPIPSLKRSKRASLCDNQYSVLVNFCGGRGIILVTEITHRRFKAAHSETGGYYYRKGGDRWSVFD
jgi:hypothetical protein